MPPARSPELPPRIVVIPEPVETREPQPVVGLERSRVKTVVLSNFDAFRGCHTLEYGDGQPIEGKLVLDWQIEADGSVETAHVPESSFENPNLDACVVRVMKNISFPRSSAPTEVSWTFRFQSASDAQLAQGN